MKKPIYLGIDPGWKNLGIGLVEELPNFKVQVISTRVCNPSLSDLNFAENLPILINQLMGDTLGLEVVQLWIERYVPYNNVFSAETENITMLIGMMRSRFFNNNPCTGVGIVPRMVRAVDWKIRLAQIMAKYAGFQNPSSSLDKVFSIALARFLTDNKYEFKTDHEADAVCIASIGILEKQAKEAAKLRDSSATDNAVVASP